MAHVGTWCEMQNFTTAICMLISGYIYPQFQHRSIMNEWNV